VSLSSYSKKELRQHLSEDGLTITTGPFSIHLQSHLDDIVDHLIEFYADYPVNEVNDFADFHVRIDFPANLRRWIKSQVYFYLDERVPFKPLPASQASPMLEWGLNWCIANHSHQYLIFHAAALEKNGIGILMPAEPGSGKSTLTAALMLKGWRLLSDELGVVDLKNGNLVPLARPVNLKNESIEIIRRFSSDARISKPYKDTNKGTVSLVKATGESIQSASRLARPKLIIHPQYQKNTSAQLEEISRARMLMHVAHNSFNYTLLAESGFDAISNMINQCDCYSFTYNDLNDAIKIFDQLVGETGE